MQAISREIEMYSQSSEALEIYVFSYFSLVHVNSFKGVTAQGQPSCSTPGDILGFSVLLKGRPA